MKRSHFIVPVFLAGMTIPLLLSSCQGEVRKHQRSEADSLSRQWSEITASLNTIDTVAVSDAWDSFQRLVDSFDTYYSDEYRETYWDAIRLFAEVKSPLKQVVRNRSRVMKDLAYSGSQIESLRNDIARRRLSEKDAEEYLQDESKALRALAEEVQVLEQNAETGLTWFAERSGPVREAIGYMRRDESR